MNYKISYEKLLNIYLVPVVGVEPTRAVKPPGF